MKNTINQFNNPFTPVECSMGNYDLQKCEPYQMHQQDINFIYLEQWFHREILDYKNLPIELQELLQMNWRFMFYPKGVYTSLKQNLIRPSFFFNSFNSTLMAVTPSRLQNYGKSEYQDCIPGKHLLNFDPRCRGWYKLAMKDEGYFITDLFIQYQGITFFNPYLQISSNTIGITISQRFDDAAGNNLSVFSFNLDITNLVDKIFRNQDIHDQNSQLEGYTVFIHSQNQTVFHHKGWNRTSGILKTWEEVEYNKTQYQFTEDQYCDFKKNVNRSINFSKNNMNIIQDINQYKDSSFIFFEKGNQKYLGLVYPLEVKSRINAYRSKDLKVQRPFFIGRVHRDIRNIIQEANFFYFTIFRTLCFVEVGFIIFILIISLLHYAAVLVHTIDFPLDFLTQFLKQFDLSQNFKAQQSQIVKSAINTTFNVKVGQDENLRQQDLIETIETGVDQTMNYPMQLMNKLQNFIISKSTPKRQTSSNQVNNSFQQQRFSQMSPKKILKNQNSMLNLNKQSSKGSCIDSNQQMNLDNSGQDNNKDQNLIAINIVGANKSSYFKQIQDGSQKSISFPKRYKSNSKTLRMITSKSKIEDGSSAINDIEQGKGVSFLSVHQNLLTHNPNYNNNQEISIDKLNESQAYNQIFKKIELKDLDCMFMEMQIIKEAFLQLEKVIILAQQDSCKGNIESSIINFCIVKSIFMKVKNLAQVSNCNYNLGLLYIRKRDFQKAGDTFETSIYNHLQSEGNGITSIQEYIQKLKCGDIKIMQEDIDQIVLLAKKIKAFVVSLRFQGIQPNFPKKDQTNMLLQGIKYSDLCIEMLQTAFHSNTHPSLLTSYITSASIYLDLGMIEQAAQYMINADIIWQIYFEKSKENENIHLSSNVSSYKNIQFQNHQISTTDFSLHKKQAISFNLNTDKNSNPSRYQMYKYSILPVEIVRSLKLMNQGRIYLELNLHQQGCQFLTEAIETGEIFDPSIRMEALMQLNKCLLLQNIDNSYIIEEIKKYSGDPLNIYIVLSCPVSPQNINYINFQIQIIQKLYHAFIKYSDRISILQYHEDLISINQLAQIQSETHLSNFLQKIQSNFISLCAEYQVQTQPTMHWTLALRQVLLKINYGQNLNKQIQFQNQLLEMLKDQQDYILQDPYSNQDYESENQNQQQEFLSQHSKIHTPINRSNINQQSLNITNQKDVKKNSDKKNIIPDIKLMQSPYKNARDLVIMISQESQTSIQNQQIKHVDPFYGFTQNQLPTVIHLKKTSLNSQNEVNNIHLQSDQDLNYEIISQISNPFTTTDKAVANKKYYQYIDFNQFFKEILSQRIYLKEEK